jgi:uncharacterized oxidoreductase
LIDCHLCGHDSHGLIRVLPYVKGLREGSLVANQHITVIFENDAVALSDGNKAFGQVAAKEATDLGIAKAAKGGIALIGVRYGGHVGRLGAWAERAAGAGQASIFFVNAPREGGASLAPFGGTDRRLGAGPFALGMPAGEGPPVVLDGSTAAVARGKVRLARNKGELLAEACIIGADGKRTDDPNALEGPPLGALLPFGAHKGSGVCMFTDLFGGILAGANADYAGEPGEWYPINNIFAVFIDPAVFAEPGPMLAAVEAYRAWVKASPPAAGFAETMLPGEMEARTKAGRAAAGIEIDAATWEQVLEGAELAGMTRDEANGFLA